MIICQCTLKKKRRKSIKKRKDKRKRKEGEIDRIHQKVRKVEKGKDHKVLVMIDQIDKDQDRRNHQSNLSFIRTI